MGVVGVLILLTLQPLSPALGSLTASDKGIQVVATGTMKLAVVALAGNTPTGAPLSVKPVGRRVFIFLKNFGTLPLKSFSLSQTTPGTVIRICETSKFVHNSLTQCDSGEVSRVVGSTTQIVNFVFTTPLQPGAYYWLSLDAPDNNQTSISVSVSSANYHPLVTNT